MSSIFISEQNSTKISYACLYAANAIKKSNLFQMKTFYLIKKKSPLHNALIISRTCIGKLLPFCLKKMSTDIY